MPADSLAGKVAVVTGASRGIGLAICRALAAAGCNLAVSARNISGLEKMLGRSGVQTLVQACDVRDAASVESFFQAVNEKFGRVDILINNAGISHPTLPVEKLPLEAWQTAIDTNLTGLFLCTRAALPLMENGGTIVNNLSVAAKDVFPGGSAYNASKHGALGFTNTLRMELRERGIRVIALLPGPTDTELWNQFWADAPRNRMIRPETVAEAVVHAVSLPVNATVEELVIMPTGGSL